MMMKAIELAQKALKEGNPPVGAVIALDGQIVGQGWAQVLYPFYHPGRHAEQMALQSVPHVLWDRASEMTCYTTLEPCMMCMGSMLLYGIGRVVFGARDLRGGSTSVLKHLPPYYANGRGVPQWIGPTHPELCDPLYREVDRIFSTLPCGHLNQSSN